jgi:hypothetical protein
LCIVTFLVFLVVQDDDFGLFGQGRLADFQGGENFCFVQPHFFQKFIEGVERNFDRRGAIVHGNDNVWFQQADHFSRFGGVETLAAADRHQCHMNGADGFNFSLGGNRAQVSKVGHGDARVVEDVEGVARFVGCFFILAVGLNAGDEHATDFKFAWAINDVTCIFDGLNIIMPWCMVADGHNVRFEFERLVADDFMIKRVGDDGRQPAFD